MIGLLAISLEARKLPLGQPNIDVLFGHQSRLVPIALQDRLASEHLAKSGVLGRLSIPLARGHDLQKGLEWRASIRDATVLEVNLGHALLSLGNIKHAIEKRIEILRLWA